MAGLQYIIFINKLYSGIFILTSVLSSSMFIYLTWESKTGQPLKALLQQEKAEKIAEQMRKLGVNVVLTPSTVN